MNELSVYELDMNTINKINNEKCYNLKIKQIGYDTCYISTTNDEWYIECIDKNKFILRHKNTRHNRNRFHIQHKFSRYDIMLEYVSRHYEKPKYKTKEDRHLDKMKVLFDKVSQNKKFNKFGKCV